MPTYTDTSRGESVARPEIPFIEPPPRDRCDRKDENEAAALGDGRDLSREKEIARHDRSEGLRSILSKGCGIIICFSIICIIVMSASYIFHMTMPDHWQYLSEMQLENIKSSLFSGAVGAFIVKYLENISW